VTSAAESAPHSLLMTRNQRIARWASTAAVALVFFLIGFSKFGASTAWGPRFARWGFPGWARPAVGTIEMVCAAALLAPRVQAWAAALLGAVMAGAIATHLWHGELPRVVPPAVLMALLALIMKWRTAARR